MFKRSKVPELGGTPPAGGSVAIASAYNQLAAVAQRSREFAKQFKRTCDVFENVGKHDRIKQ
jgi:hypothetical protein